MKKVISNNLTAGMLSENFKQRVKELIAKDKVFSFMSSIKGTPAYWKNFLHQVLAMVRQLGTPTFFLTLSCADLRCNELISEARIQQGDPGGLDPFPFFDTVQIVPSNS